MESLSDDEIIRRVLGGSTRSFADLVERHQDKAMTLATRMLRNREEAEEAVQDAFVRAFNGLQRFEKRSRFSTWFYRIVFNVCSTALSKRGELRHLSSEGAEEEGGVEIPDLTEMPDAIVEGEDFRRHVLDAMNGLPPLYSGIVTMFYLDDLGYEEIAAITGSPLGTVKARLFRARAMLREGILQRTGTKEFAR
ncbi:MAG TPA: sigma-70 family RNA polymerase sigma factor [Bacteroidota bacterium]|nr:sigma-70 family RNA polymerase sigma factor [Bacteroidota bacterium]